MDVNTDNKRKALGRGLEVLLPSTRPPLSSTSPSEESPTREIPVTQIERNPYQTRSRFDEIALAELAASINASGVIQPILVRPLAGGGFQLIAGERRWLASQKAGKTTIPAVVRQVSNEQAMEMTIIENLQREDLNAIEQARAYERLSNEFNLTQEQMAIKTGKDRATVSNFMRLLRLPTKVQDMIESNELSFGHAKALLMLDNQPMMERVAGMITTGAMSVRQAEKLINSILHPQPREQKANPSQQIDPNVLAAQEQLQRALGVKVMIDDKRGKGKITIEYYSLEDFDRIVEALGT